MYELKERQFHRKPIETFIFGFQLPTSRDLRFFSKKETFFLGEFAAGFSETGGDDSHHKVKTLLLAVRRLEAAHSEVSWANGCGERGKLFWRFDNYFEMFFFGIDMIGINRDMIGYDQNSRNMIDT